MPGAKTCVIAVTFSGSPSWFQAVPKSTSIGAISSKSIIVITASWMVTFIAAWVADVAIAFTFCGRVPMIASKLKVAEVRLLVIPLAGNVALCHVTFVSSISRVRETGASVPGTKYSTVAKTGMVERSYKTVARVVPNGTVIFLCSCVKLSWVIV